MFRFVFSLSFFFLFVFLCFCVHLSFWQGGVICFCFLSFVIFLFLLCFCAHIHSSICHSWGRFISAKWRPCFMRDSALSINVFFWWILIVRAESPILIVDVRKWDVSRIISVSGSPGWLRRCLTWRTTSSRGTSRGLWRTQPWQRSWPLTMILGVRELLLQTLTSR